MGSAARVLASAGLPALLACLAVASCGLDRAGLLATDDGGAVSGLDGTVDTGQGVTSDAQADEAPGDAGSLDDALTTDVATADVTTGDVFGVDVATLEAAPPADAAAESAPPTCGACLAGACCNAGACTPVRNQACGDPTQTCFDCTASPTGNQCIQLGGHEVCGCAGPANPDQCPPGNACHNQQCGLSCDGQHPCNGGCCSGNDLATSTCVAVCPGGKPCAANYCH